jgi:hypothetical protein
MVLGRVSVVEINLLVGARTRFKSTKDVLKNRYYLINGIVVNKQAGLISLIALIE